MQKGTIARLDPKGYGFIKIDGNDKDLFFHSNELKEVTFDSLNEGDELEFDVEDGVKGPQAVQVSRV